MGSMGPTHQCASFSSGVPCPAAASSLSAASAGPSQPSPIAMLSAALSAALSTLLEMAAMPPAAPMAPEGSRMTPLGLRPPRLPAPLLSPLLLPAVAAMPERL